MRLSEFIKANGERIIKEWEEFAKTFGAGAGLPRWMLRDHASAIVKFIVEDMERPQRAARPRARGRVGRSSMPRRFTSGSESNRDSTWSR
jgi:hypothetical protein